MTASIILGTGSYTPDKIITNDDMSKIVDTSDEWIKTRTGIRQRRLLRMMRPVVIWLSKLPIKPLSMQV